ncbi:hypothetical protein KC19_5G158800 [Ceratodon purpureus]|uniref:Uncharacterized protein n=1 Tax=Ceratodon purpureus TaxID=3225 RepID=A0A8T0I3V7_CERPU|nr:hypothetical protein KC19_5G158800 [Ceratodon purpureus]
MQGFSPRTKKPGTTIARRNIFRRRYLWEIPGPNLLSLVGFDLTFSPMGPSAVLRLVNKQNAVTPMCSQISMIQFLHSRVQQVASSQEFDAPTLIRFWTVKGGNLVILSLTGCTVQPHQTPKPMFASI